MIESAAHQPASISRRLRFIKLTAAIRLALTFMAALLALATGSSFAADAPLEHWLFATAYAVPKETTSHGEGYFSIIEGHNGRLYIGTAHYPRGGYLVEFDTAAEEMRIVVDPMKEIGSDAKGFAAQGKIHTRNNVGAGGKIYFATKQEHAFKGEKAEEYPGGYPMVYDPRTSLTRVYPIPVPHQGIISIIPDEARGVAYISTCGDGKFPDNAHFLVLDLKTGEYRDLMHTQLNYAFVVIDHLGRAYHPIKGGDIARYDPRTDRLERLTQTINGVPPADTSDLVTAVCLNWETSPDRKTMYAASSAGNNLYAYDLTGTGNTLAGRRLGPLVPDAERTGFVNLCVGPTGTVWVAMTVPAHGIQLHRLISYRPGDPAPVDLGPVAIRNPDYTPFTDADGKLLPAHDGMHTMPDGTVTTRHVVQGVCEARDGAVYVLILRPYTVLKIKP
jgi:hypothetical protein